MQGCGRCEYNMLLNTTHWKVFQKRKKFNCYASCYHAKIGEACLCNTWVVDRSIHTSGQILGVARACQKGQ